VSDRLKVTAQYLIPKQALTVLAGKLASARAGGLTTG
jgi:phosphatidylserine decarboxylase